MRKRVWVRRLEIGSPGKTKSIKAEVGGVTQSLEGNKSREKGPLGRGHRKGQVIRVRKAAVIGAH